MRTLKTYWKKFIRMKQDSVSSGNRRMIFRQLKVLFLFRYLVRKLNFEKEKFGSLKIDCLKRHMENKLMEYD